MQFEKEMIPGFVPFSQGKFLEGISWFLGTLLGYLYCIVPGIIAHYFYLNKYYYNKTGQGRYSTKIPAKQSNLETKKNSQNNIAYPPVGQSNLDKAVKLAKDTKLGEAIQVLQQVPESSSLHQEAQRKIFEYKQQLDEYYFSIAQNLIATGQIIDKDTHFKHELSHITLSTSNFNIFKRIELTTKATAQVLAKENQIQDKIVILENCILYLNRISSNSNLYEKAQLLKNKYYEEIANEKVKRRVEYSGRAIEVIKIREQKNLSSKNSMCDTISGRIILVDMNFQNTSKKSGNFQFSDFQLVDENNCIYDEITDMTYTLWRQEQGFKLRAEDYYPGEIHQDIACFRVSPSARSFTLKWNGQTIKL